MEKRRYFNRNEDNSINKPPIEVLDNRKKLFRFVYVFLCIFFIVSAIVFVYMIYVWLKQSIGM